MRAQLQTEVEIERATVHLPGGFSYPTFACHAEANYSPFRPAQIHGPVERCHPAEGGALEDMWVDVACGPSPLPRMNEITFDALQFEAFAGQANFNMIDDALWDRAIDEGCGR